MLDSTWVIFSAALGLGVVLAVAGGASFAFSSVGPRREPARAGRTRRPHLPTVVESTS